MCKMRIQVDWDGKCAPAAGVLRFRLCIENVLLLSQLEELSFTSKVTSTLSFDGNLKNYCYLYRDWRIYT